MYTYSRTKGVCGMSYQYQTYPRSDKVRIFYVSSSLFSSNKVDVYQVHLYEKKIVLFLVG